MDLKAKRRLLVLAVIVLFIAGAGLGGWLLLLARTGPAVKKLPEMVRSDVKTHGGTYVPLSEMPQTLLDALVDTEDRSFYHNAGIDPSGIVRSLLVDIKSGELDQGGSTITQQLARNMLLNPQKTFARKAKEILLALVVTHYFSKNDILEMYLNEVYLGHGAYGLDRAASIYFNAKPEDLTQAQCVMLAGIPQGPSIYDPLSNLPAARERQREVLDSMVQAGTITATKADQIFAEPLGLIKS